MNWQALNPLRYRLAEGAFWDAPTQALYWVDIAGFKACRLQDGELRHWQLSEPVSAFIPTQAGDALVTLASGVHRLDLDSPPHAPRITLWCQADPVPGNRANEARCDPQGRLWLGSMQNNLDAEGADLPLERRSGGLFRIDEQARVEALLEGQGIVNTLLWTADGTTLLSADTLDGVIYHYPLDAQGLPGPRHVWAAQHPRGDPDGSAMDAQGFVWNARWGGHCLLRFAPDGSLDRVVELPVEHPTSCVFGGADLSRLYVTSSCQAGSDNPLDGAVLWADVGVAGQPCQRFAG
ncbi:senescence marker protein-30 [Pseudomonas sp. M47T1]|uniref:SMP-30/gluconolactonase/LRE family protein n=1 Tax=Pseudomonas sp. M47T1 TaxID=1179778 RepID=UPI0002608341|nr:SMP-30/gluconolactonase/LRE family protein [Pseudomonas sp. M47T1]EIK93958.1 senescence marker protein-30 [Pseudomonas sp. M47T1]